MHPLRNGSQVTARPARKATVGTAGYFSESNDNGQPSYPGQDWFNDVIDEFKNALAASNIAYVPGDLTHLAQVFARYSLSSSTQFLPYDPTRVYKCGEVCYTVTAGKVSYWEWYSNVESLAGKDPLNTLNRQTGWTDETKPFYWTPFKKSRSGSTQWPWMSMTFPEGTLNVLGNSVPIAVFWRLAEALPEFVNVGTGMIDFPETGGEFFRVLDQGRGIDVNRTFGSWQKASIVAGDIAQGGNLASATGMVANDSNYGLENSGVNITNYPNASASYVNGTPLSIGQTSLDYFRSVRPRNLAFPMLVEI